MRLPRHHEMPSGRMPVAGSETKRFSDGSMELPDCLLADLGREACDQEVADQGVEAVR